MTKILYVAGWGRSGTTILDNLLGQVEGVVSTGELHNVWQRGLVDNRLCGCGLPIRECETWRTVFERGFGGMDAVDPGSVIRSQGEAHTRNARALLKAKNAGSLMERYLYAESMRKLYDGIASVSGARVIVDSSKYPADAILAAGLPGYDVHVLHMVRDPRAVAFSWHRHKASPGKKGAGGMLTRVGMLRSTAVWVFYNAVISRYVKRAVPAARYRLLQYERLATEPEAVLDELIEFLSETPAYRPAFAENTVEMVSSHTASGNPVRFSSGSIGIRLDDEWTRAMPRWRRGFITLLAAPMLRTARYRWRLSQS